MKNQRLNLKALNILNFILFTAILSFSSTAKAQENTVFGDSQFRFSSIIRRNSVFSNSVPPDWRVTFCTRNAFHQVSEQVDQEIIDNLDGAQTDEYRRHEPDTACARYYYRTQVRQVLLPPPPSPSAAPSRPLRLEN